MGRARQLKRLKKAIRSEIQRQANLGADGHQEKERSESPHLALVPSRWDERPEAERATIEALDGFAHVRNKLREIAAERGDWCGLPVPVSDSPLVLEPKFRYQGLAEINRPKPEAPDPTLKHRNTFWSKRWRCDITIFEDNGRARFAPVVGTGNQATMLVNTIGASYAWGIEQESNALHLLATLVRHHTFKHYLLTGTFLESSKRSGVSYMFRKLRPTVAMVDRKGAMKVLTTLCSHPVGYYAGSWAGAMCPTDDVIAHLMLMRADEPKFWARCNQHSPSHPASGL